MRNWEVAWETMIGARNGTRTRDPELGKLVLYQLSYSRSNEGWKSQFKMYFWKKANPDSSRQKISISFRYPKGLVFGIGEGFSGNGGSGRKPRGQKAGRRWSRYWSQYKPVPGSEVHFGSCLDLLQFELWLVSGSHFCLNDCINPSSLFRKESSTVK